MAAEWLQVVYLNPLTEGNILEPKKGMKAASEEAVNLLRILFPEKDIHIPGSFEPPLCYHYVVKHIAKGKVCVISNLAHIQLFVQLNHAILMHWMFSHPLNKADNIKLWPVPAFKLQAFKWTESIM